MRSSTAVVGRRRGVGAAAVLPDLLEVAADAERPLRAGESAVAAGLATEKAKVEGLRSKLKPLAARGWPAAAPGGLFTLPDHAGKQENPHGKGFFLGSEVLTRGVPPLPGDIAAIGCSWRWRSALDWGNLIPSFAKAFPAHTSGDDGGQRDSADQ